jgi:hypothetical protein
MRKLLLIVLVALLPMQWSVAAVGLGCLHGGAAGVHAGHGLRGPTAHEGAGHDRHVAHAHAVLHEREAHGHEAHGQAADELAAHGHVAHEQAPATAPSDLADGGADSAGLADDCLHADCDLCCHAGGGTLAPSAARFATVPTIARALAASADRAARAPAPDGPFRPPRARSA